MPGMYGNGFRTRNLWISNFLVKVASQLSNPLFGLKGHETSLIIILSRLLGVQIRKLFYKSQNNSKELVRELQIIHTYQNVDIVEIHGISQHSETGDMIYGFETIHNGIL
ncbi:28157_t:CDS:2, partial [Racocetra persica]